MSARSIWKGMLSVGLVSVPVKLYKATDDRDEETAMRQLHGTCSTPINQFMRCMTCNVDVPYADIVKGVEQAKGVFVVLSKDEIASIRAKTTDHIAVEAFVPLAQVLNPLWVETSYYLTPDGQAGRLSFVTVREAMVSQNRAMQGLLTIHGRERVVTIVPSAGGGLTLQTMRTKSLVRDKQELPNFVAEGAQSVEREHLKLAEQLVKSMTADFDPTDYEDGYAESFRTLVAAKAAGTPMVNLTPNVTVPTADLMQALRASLTATAPKTQKKVKALPVKAVAKAKPAKSARA